MTKCILLENEAKPASYRKSKRNGSGILPCQVTTKSSMKFGYIKKDEIHFRVETTRTITPPDVQMDTDSRGPIRVLARSMPFNAFPLLKVTRINNEFEGDEV
ncbi:unnamed protein product [Dovyalis caffra]|uniref:Uncharacterized protein n=1 Tax=Dovyalis caffra TaxID=77055 RepID=A0AAV1RBN6_9ROSI|nr:unnamed protein product [Dovyalis caffra]